jgi:hypothetical protein
MLRETRERNKGFTIMMKEMLLRDVLYNLAEGTGAGSEYCKGLVVGVVSALMAESGRPYSAIIRVVRDALPVGFRADCLPEAYSTDLNG